MFSVSIVVFEAKDFRLFSPFSDVFLDLFVKFLWLVVCILMKWKVTSGKCILLDILLEWFVNWNFHWKGECQKPCNREWPHRPRHQLQECCFLFCWQDFRGAMYLRVPASKLWLNWSATPLISEISNFNEHLLSRLKQNVLNLQVSVNTVLSMTVGNSAGNLSEVMFRLLLWNGFSLSKKIQQFSSLKVFHININSDIFKHVLKLMTLTMLGWFKALRFKFI